MIRFACVLSVMLCALLSGPLLAVDSILLSEIRTDQFSTDVDEFFELPGPSGASLAGVTYLVIGEQSGSGSGGIEMALDLTGNVIPSDGYFLVAEDSFENGTGEVFFDITPDLIAGNALNFENSDNVTHLIVQGYDPNFPSFPDIDLNDDGVLFPNDPSDPNVWSSVLDAVGFVEDFRVHQAQSTFTVWNWDSRTLVRMPVWSRGFSFAMKPNWTLGRSVSIGWTCRVSTTRLARSMSKMVMDRRVISTTIHFVTWAT